MYVKKPRRKFAIAKTRSVRAGLALARVTRALPRTVRFSRAIAIAFCVLSAVTITAAAQHTETAVAQIRSVLRAQQDAWNKGDIDGFMNGYARSASTLFVSEDTIRRGWQTVRDRYKKKYPSRAKMGTLTFSDLEITLLSSDSAVASGRWQLKRASGLRSRFGGA